MPRLISLLRVHKSSCLPKLKSIIILLNDLSTVNEDFTFFVTIFVMLKSCLTAGLSHKF